MADAIALASSITQLLVAIRNVVGYIADVRHSSDERSQLAAEVRSLIPILDGIHTRLASSDADGAWVENVRVLNSSGGPMGRFQGTLERLQKSLVTRPSGTITVKERLAWSFDKNKIIGWIGETERFKTTLILAMQNDQMLLSKAIKNDTSQMVSINAAINNSIQDLSGLSIVNAERVSKERIREILDWLSPLDFRRRQNAAFQFHLEGSNEWFISSEVFQNWSTGSRKVLCCEGEPGTGKTVLLSQIIQRLKSLYPACPVLYAYCEYHEKSLQAPSDFIAAFLKQIIQFEDKIPREVEEMYVQYERQGTRPTPGVVLALLKEKLGMYPSSFIVIDALDEYHGSQDALLQKIAPLQGTSSMLFSARATFLEAWLSNIQSLGFNSPIGIRFQAASQDIELYIREQLPTLPRYLIQDGEMEQQILESVVNVAAGRFLVAVLSINLLRDCTTKKEGRIALQRLANQDSSSTLDELYKQTLERIQVQDAGFYRLAERTLGWLAWTMACFETVLELQHALATEVGTPDLDEENIPEIHTIICACLGMVVFDTASWTIRFVHDSAAICTRKFFYEKLISTHCDILEACLTYLSFDAFQTGPCETDEEMGSRLDKYPFLPYAATYWGDHARECVQNVALVDDKCMELRPCVLQYLSLTENRNSAAQVEYGTSYGHVYTANYPKELAAISVAASFGLTSIIDLLLAEDANINAQDSYGCTPLNRAARRGHQWAILFLLQKGADMNISDNYGQDSLHMAAWNGHTYAVEALVESGINVNARDHEGQTALHKAAAQGHQQIVVYLARNGADLSIRDNSHRSPVDLAIFEGHEALKWPMLQSWVRDLEPDDYKRPALHQAVRYGTTAQVEQILESGHDVNEADDWGRTALLEAAHCGLKSMAELLIDRGAEIGWEGPYYCSVPSRENALSLAADSCYVNYHGEKGKATPDDAQRREKAISIIRVILRKLIATYGPADGLKKALGNEENQQTIVMAALQPQEESDLLQLATKLIFQEAGYRDGQRPRPGGSRFE